MESLRSCAGLLPRLDERVRTVYVEATLAQTEASLLAALRRTFRDLPGDLALVSTLAALHRGRALPKGQKVLIVLDQFEQWLFAKGDSANPELVAALRQCDGGRIQAIALVRDDFAMAAARFMDELEVPLVQGRNFAAVDLFDPSHARKVLSLFGQAYSRLNDPDIQTSEMSEFLDQAVAGLARSGKVTPVQLSVLVETIKDRPWNRATLKKIGAIDSIGVEFLERSLGARSTNPKYRRHAAAARAVLATLMPGREGGLKGRRRTWGELRIASGHLDDPDAFAAMIQILDSEMKLITPVDQDGSEIFASGGEPAALSPPEIAGQSIGDGPQRKSRASFTSGDDDAGYPLAELPQPRKSLPSPEADPASLEGRTYQLAHDYLVAPLTLWLAPERSHRLRDWVRWRLETRAKEWGARPQRRRLPTWWEWLNILVLTDRKAWTDAQRLMMRSATRDQIAHGAVAAILLASAVLAGASIFRSLHTQLEFQTMKMRADKFEVRHYASQLARATAELRLNRPAAALAILDECSRSLRHWEWHYLKHLSRIAAGETDPTDLADIPASPPDGRNYGASGSYGYRDDHVKAFTEDRSIYIKPMQGPPSAVAVSGDGTQYARGGLRGKIRIWKRSGRPQGSEVNLAGPDVEVLSMEFSPDDRQLAAATGSCVTIFDLQSQSVLRTLEPHGSWIRAVTYSPDGRMIATASDDMTVKIFDANRGRLLHTLGGHGGGAKAVGFSPDGRRLASRGESGALILWEPETGEQVFDLTLTSGLAGTPKPKSEDRWIRWGWVNWWSVPSLEG